MDPPEREIDRRPVINSVPAILEEESFELDREKMEKKGVATVVTRENPD